MQPRWRYLIHPEYMEAERNPRSFVRAHAPLIVAFALCAFLPPVQAWTGLRPVPVAVLLAAHLVMFGSFVFHPAPIRHPWIWSQVAMLTNLAVSAGVAGTTGNPRSLLWGFYFLYTLVLSAAGRPSIISLLAVITVPLGVGAFWHWTGMLPFGEGLGGLVTIGIASAVCHLSLGIIFTVQRSARQEFQRLKESAAEAGERRRIARDLHDTLGAALAEVSLWQEVAARAERENASDALERARARMREAVEELRACVGSLDGAELPTTSVRQLLSSRLSGLCAAAEMELELEVRSGPSLPVTTLHQLLKIAQEAVSNAVRHGHPRKVAVVLDPAGPVLLEVRDDGSGFDPASAPRGTGLSSMGERAEKLGARLEVVSRPGEGTVLVMKIDPAAGAVRLTA